MTKKDYYEILGVTKTDSSETIKKNYKKLALKFHPDKATDNKKKEYEEKFKEINEAYSIIGDEEKRKRYDIGENHPFSQESSSHGGDFSDILRNIFRGGSFRSPFGEEDEDEESEIDPNLRYELTIEFNEAAFGCEKELLIQKNIFCDSCDGTGAEKKQFKSCYKCNGQGRIKVSQKTPWGIINQVVRCSNCEGAGQIPENKCQHCNGSGVLTSKEKVKIKIPRGIDNGQTLRIKNGGNAIKNSSEGDLFLLIHVRPHKIFKRRDFDIFMELSISFSQAALGNEISIPILSQSQSSEEKIKIKVAKGTESGSILRLKGKGIPVLNSSSRRGDQFVNITVKTPKKLSKEQTRLFEELAKLDDE